MPRWPVEEPDWDGESEYDADEKYGDDDDEDEPTIPCPWCRREIHEESQRCPYCARYISDEDAPARKPWWLVLGVVICLYVVYRWIVPW